MLGFRVWDSEEKKFINTDSFVMSDSGMLAKLNGLGGVYCSDRYIPMQSTGIEDFQGTMIYEGDVVWIRYLLLGTDGKPLFNRAETTYLHVKNVIDFLQIVDRLCPIDKMSCDGNVYDHPALLEMIKENE